MDKLLAKKNLGISATLLVVIAYFLGYYISVNYAGFLVAIVFAVIVFALDFDDRVKTAVKQAYILGLFFCLIYLGLGIFDQMTVLVTRVSFVNTLFDNLYTYANSIFTMFVIIVFAILIILALCKKDTKINFLLSIIGEGAPKPQPMYQQPIPPMQPMPQQMPPQQMPGPMYQQPVPPMPQQSAPAAPAQPTCPKCGTINHPGAAFCASCGTKL